MYALHWLQFGGFAEVFSQVVVGAGAVVLLLILVALGSFAYRSRHGGVEWPEDKADEDGDGVSKGGDDDEWEFY